MDGELHEMSAVAQTEFGFYALTVGLDRFDAQIERMRGLASAHPLAHRMQDLKLSVTQPIDGICRHRSFSVRGPLHDIGHYSLGCINTAVEYATHGAQYLLSG